MSDADVIEGSVPKGKDLEISNLEVISATWV